MFLSLKFAVGALAFCVLGGKHDSYKSIEEICMENGFSSEAYTVETEDGYELGLWRIPGQFSEPITDEKKPVVLMVHGLGADMMQWVFNTHDKAPAFVVSRYGYDVWLANNRGTKYSLGHKTLDHKDKAYWDYYQEELGTKDLPTLINFIKAKTGVETVSYMGHSQGTTQFMLGASLLPEYFTANLNIAILLAPVANTKGVKVPAFREASKHIKMMEYMIVNVFHEYNLPPPMPAASHFTIYFCEMFKFACKTLAKSLHHEGVDNFDLLPISMANVPSGQSYRCTVYYGQMINSGRMALYDYGKRQNQKKYGSDEPPLVPLVEKYSVPTAIFSGSMDHLADPEDVEQLQIDLGANLVFNHQYNFDHFSFAVAKDMSFLPQDVVPLLKQYNPVNQVEFLQ